MGSAEQPKAFGWIGLGNMGYGMCMNLTTKMPPSASLVILDLNTTAMDKFVAEAESKGVKNVSKVASPKEVTAKSVSLSLAVLRSTTISES